MYIYTYITIIYTYICMCVYVYAHTTYVIVHIKWKTYAILPDCCIPPDTCTPIFENFTRIAKWQCS